MDMIITRATMLDGIDNKYSKINSSSPELCRMPHTYVIWVHNMTSLKVLTLSIQPLKYLVPHSWPIVKVESPFTISPVNIMTKRILLECASCTTANSDVRDGI